MSLHKELPRNGSSKVTRKPNRSGARPRGSRAAMARNPLFHHIFPGFMRFNFFEEIGVQPVILPVQKSWHRSLKLRDRAHIIDELTHFFTHIATEEARKEHATNLEGFMCEAANTKQEYEMLLSLFQRANGEHEESSTFDMLSNCSSKPDESDHSYDSSVELHFSSEPEENKSFSSDHDSDHYGGSESDY